MEVQFIPDSQPGDILDCTIYQITATEDTGFGTGLKFLLKEYGTDRTIFFFTPDTVTPRNRLGRTVVRLLGELRAFDTEALIGMTVQVHYVSKKTNAAEAVADMLTPRKPNKGEDPKETVDAALVAEAARDQSTPF